MDEYADGIVTYPGPARSQLGLQWRVGASFEDVQGAVERSIPSELRYETSMQAMANQLIEWANERSTR